MDTDEKREALRRSFKNYSMAGYSAVPSGSGHLLGDGFYYRTNVLRGIDFPSSQIGLFGENQDTQFWWFDSSGKIVHENTTHCNNVGLVSSRDYSAARGPDEFRIAVLGDEMTAATTANASWPDSTEHFLNQNSTNNRTYRVFNFGHLDAGLVEYRRIWQERARHFDIDMLIVNLADHTFHRIGEIYTCISHWDRVPGFRYVFYTLPDGQQAVTWIRCAEGATSLRDPNCYINKLLTFWIDPEVARNQHLMAQLRDMVITDYIDGADIEGSADYLNPREHAHPTIPTYSDQERMEYVCEHLTWFSQCSPHVLFLMNPWWSHFENYSLLDHRRYESLSRLSEMNDHLSVVDMRRDHRLWGGSDTATLYCPYATEKWSDEGHRLYGQAVGDVVLDHLR